MSETDGAYFVTRTTRTLEMLALSPRTTAELAELLGVHQRTSRRLLARLADEGYVVKLPGHRGPYALTRRLPALGMCALATADRPPMTGSVSPGASSDDGLGAPAVASQRCPLCILPVMGVLRDSRAGAAGNARHDITPERSVAAR